VRRCVLTSLALALVGAAAAGGCQESGFDESRETARPLKVQHALGDIGGTKVPGQARRPAALTADALDDTLALGLRPVWASAPGGRMPPHLRAQAAGIEVAPPVTKLDLAALEATQPDLILGSKQDQERLYPDLSRIAPTIVTDAGPAGWKLNLRLHGEALGRTNDAERLLIDWDRRASAARRAIGEGAGRTVAVVLVTRAGPFAAGAESFAAALLADVGLARPASQRGPGERVPLSAERIRTLAGDLILLAVMPGAESAARRLQASGPWRRLPPVRAGAVQRVDAAVWWGGGGILAARAALRDLEDVFGS
jgi:iron complex transport system substrate-binding protein